MIGHDAAIQTINSLSRGSVRRFTPQEHVNHLTEESDRVHMILAGSTIDDLLLENIKTLLPGDLNSDDRSRLYDYDGPLGSFGSRTLFALALGIIDRTARKQIDIIRAIRNAAAHSLERLDYTNKKIQTGLTGIARTDHLQKRMANFDSTSFRKFHGAMAVSLTRVMSEQREAEINVGVLVEMCELDQRDRQQVESD